MADTSTTAVQFHVPFRHSAGERGSQFLTYLRGGQLVGWRLAATGKVELPPRSAGAKGDWLPLGPGGKIELCAPRGTAFDEGHLHLALVRPEGASEALLCRLYLATGQPIPPVGSRAEIRFAKERQGSMTDFWFVPEPPPPSQPAAVVIRGAAEAAGRDLAVESVVPELVQKALDQAQLALEAVDLVVLCGSDLLDGGMVALRASMAGGFGKEMLNIPSGAGHALGAALAALASGQAKTVLVVGWGEGRAFDEIDGRDFSADPFYTRPIGGTAKALAELQAQALQDRAGFGAAEIAAYAKAIGRAGNAANRLTPALTNGAAALVLGQSGAGARAVSLGQSFREWAPQAEALDPLDWLRAALNPGFLPAGLVEVELAGPNLTVEAAAARALTLAAEGRLAASGGGSANWFGPATGLRQLALCATSLRQRPGRGLFVDLTGPIGQATTALVLEGHDDDR